MITHPTRLRPAAICHRQRPPKWKPLTEYRLEVDVEGKKVRASTTTPERLRAAGRRCWLDEDTQEIVRTLKSFAEVGDEVYTAPENQLTHLEGLIELHLEKAGEAYQAALFALEENAQLLDEDFPDLFDEDLDALRANQSPPFAASDGIVRWPWFAVVYTGRSLIKVYALDHNWFEYARSSPDLQEQGGSAGGLAGENFERPFFQVEGGIGLFGSASVDSVGFVVLPRP